jgi:hypothetical protein
VALKDFSEGARRKGAPSPFINAACSDDRITPMCNQKTLIEKHDTEAQSKTIICRP